MSDFPPDSDGPYRRSGSEEPGWAPGWDAPSEFPGQPGQPDQTGQTEPRRGQPGYPPSRPPWRQTSEPGYQAGQGSWDGPAQSGDGSWGDGRYTAPGHQSWDTPPQSAAGGESWGSTAQYGAGNPGWGAPPPQNYQAASPGGFGGATTTATFPVPPGAGAGWQPGGGGPNRRWPIIVEFADRAPQRRTTILLRLLLAIPHVVALGVVGIAAYVVTIIGWFGALFTGQLPQFATDFLTGYLRWLTRYYAYVLLFTDVYPRFTLDDYDYPVRVYVRPDRLNRMAVLFRLVLLIPAGLVVGLLTYGLSVVAVVFWLIALVTGGLPASASQAEAAVIRYFARYYGYALMLTGDYPKGLYGDPAQAEYQAADAQPGYAQPDYSQPVAGPGAVAPGTLTLTRGAKGLVTLFLVLGVAVSVAIGVLIVSATNGGAVQASLRATLAYGTLNKSLGTEDAASSSCHTLKCATAIETKVSSDYQAFAVALRGISMPSSAATQAGALITAANHAASVFATVGEANTTQQYNQRLSALDPQGAASQVSADFSSLQAVLAGQGATPGTTQPSTGTSQPTTGGTSAAALSQVLKAETPLNNSLHAFATLTRSCNNSLACLTKADRRLARAYRHYQSAIAGVQFPASAVKLQHKLETAASRTAAALSTMAAEPTLAQWASAYTAVHFNTHLNTTEKLFDNLVHALAG
ncbi:MAG TPA: DUF4389 domain-containing protein [Streptosporangiaceae bacterium]